MQNYKTSIYFYKKIVITNRLIHFKNRNWVIFYNCVEFLTNARNRQMRYQLPIKTKKLYDETCKKYLYGH